MGDAYFFIILNIATAIFGIDAFRSKSARNFDRFSWGALGLVALLSIFALTLASPTITHDHNTYGTRMDCARDPECSADTKRAFSPMVFHVYGVILRELPPLSITAHRLSLAFCLLACLLFYSSIRTWVESTKHARHGGAFALGALAFVVVHPAFVRMAYAETFWSFGMACFWMSVRIALCMQRSNARAITPLIALGWLFVAISTNRVMFVLLPFPVLAAHYWKLHWRSRTSTLVISLGGLLLFAVFIFFEACEAASAAQNAYTITFGPFETLKTVVWRQIYLDPRRTSFFWKWAALVGGMSLALTRERKALPLLYCMATLGAALGLTVDLEIGYPGRFIHDYPIHFFFAILASLGAGRIMLYCLASARPWVSAIIPILCLVTIPLARESWLFLRTDTAVGRELVALSKILPTLPKHDVLVIAPAILQDIQCAHEDRDPVEVHFPRGEYQYAMSRRGLRPGIVTTIDDFLGHPELHRDALIYIGTSLQSFVPCEIREGKVPQSLERPILEDLRTHAEMEPVVTFTLPTAQHPFVAQRLLADQRSEATLGFYRLRLRK